ncbi:RNA-binding protein 39-like [Salvia divinorum]|uniref:RNA-binding protein 39-like n=1 Tax=Salvia divinorum TaxID=28513 RepID=A0ABD1I594_SALDI
MDFDEYEYLENTVENPEAKKSEGKTNGDGKGDYEEKDRSRSSKRRSVEEDGDDLDHPSKPSRSRNESYDHEKDKGSSSRDRERGERGERGERRVRDRREHRTRDKDVSSGRERNRDKERDSDKKRNGNRERRERDNERDRIKDEELERSKRSRNHSERHHEERTREKSKEVENVEPEFKPRERVFRNQDRDNRRYKDKKDEKVEPEVDPERDQRTVFAYQITLKAGERDIYEFFSRAGKVRDVRLIMDRNTRRSKGVGYIEFYDSMSVPMAIALSGQPLLGQPVMVKPSEAEKNLVQSTTAASGGLLGPYSGGARRLYVGNLPLTIKEEQFRQVFEPFGAVELVQMPSDPGTGNCKGYAFIQFARLEDAKAAQNLNGQLEIAGRSIKVSAITDQAGMQEAGVNLADLDDDEGNGLVPECTISSASYAEIGPYWDCFKYHWFISSINFWTGLWSDASWTNSFLYDCSCCSTRRYDWCSK